MLNSYYVSIYNLYTQGTRRIPVAPRQQDERTQLPRTASFLSLYLSTSIYL